MYCSLETFKLSLKLRLQTEKLQAGRPKTQLDAYLKFSSFSGGGFPGWAENIAGSLRTDNVNYTAGTLVLL